MRSHFRMLSTGENVNKYITVSYCPDFKYRQRSKFVNKLNQQVARPAQWTKNKKTGFSPGILIYPDF